MRVGPRRSHEIAVADYLADPRPRDPGEMKQRYPAMSQVVGRKHRHAGSRARALQCGAEPVRTEPVEHGPIGDAILAGHERGDGLEDHGRRRHRACWPRSRPDGDGPLSSGRTLRGPRRKEGLPLVFPTPERAAAVADVLESSALKRRCSPLRLRRRATDGLARDDGRPRARGRAPR
jgi:hypothetical protein